MPETLERHKSHAHRRAQQAQTMLARALCIGDEPVDGMYAPLEPELAHSDHRFEGRAGHLPCGDEIGHGDGQVEGRAALAQIRWGEVHHDAI